VHSTRSVRSVRSVRSIESESRKQEAAVMVGPGGEEVQLSIVSRYKSARGEEGFGGFGSPTDMGRETDMDNGDGDADAELMAMLGARSPNLGYPSLTSGSKAAATPLSPEGLGLGGVCDANASPEGEPLATADAFACTGYIQVKVRNTSTKSAGNAETEVMTVTTTHVPMSRPLPVCLTYEHVLTMLGSMLKCDVVEVKFTEEEMQWHVSVAEELGTLMVDGKVLEEVQAKAKGEVMAGKKFCPLTMLDPRRERLIVADMQQDDRFSGHPMVTGPPHVRFFAATWIVSDAHSSSGKDRHLGPGEGRQPWKYGILYLADKAPRSAQSIKDIEGILSESSKVLSMAIDEYKLKAIKELLLVAGRTRRRSLDALTGVQRAPDGTTGDVPNPSGPSALNSTNEDAVSLWLNDNNTDLSDDFDDGVSKMKSAVDCFQDGCMLVECVVGTKYAIGWTVMHVNDALSKQLECDTQPMVGAGFWEFFMTDISERSFSNTLVRENRPFELSVTFQNTMHPNAAMHVLEFKPAANLAPPPGSPRSTGSAGERSVQNPNRSINLTLGSWQSYDSVPSSAAINSMPSSHSPRGSGEIKRFFFAHVKPSNNGGIGISGRSLQLSKEAPRVFKDIRLGPLIGRGAYGRVYRGNWNGNVVAVKVIASEQKIKERKPADSSRPDTKGLHEAVLSAALSHPNVLHTYQYSFRHVPVSADVESTDGKTGGPSDPRGPSNPSVSGRGDEPAITELWLVSEYCNRGPLLTAIENGLFMIQGRDSGAGSHSADPPLGCGSQTNLIYILQTAQEISAAMEYLHGHDVVHGDLTGGNVLLQSSDKDGRGFTAKVVDFGLSRVCAGGSLKTSKMGCAEYMPPELISRGLLTKAGDVYAFGVILWELYIGKRAWEGMEPADVLAKVSKGESLEFPAHTPRRLRILGERCLSTNGEQRPTFSDIVHEVNTILADTMTILRKFLGVTGSSSV